MLDAHKLFQQLSHANPAKRYSFKYMNCFTILKDSPKWQLQQEQRKKPIKVISKVTVETSSLSSLDQEESPLVSVDSIVSRPTRPFGNKQAKAEKSQASTMERNAKVTEELAQSIKRKAEVMAAQSVQQSIVKKVMFDEKLRVAEDKNALRTVTLLLKRNPDCPIASKLLEEHAEAALRRLQDDKDKLTATAVTTTEPTLEDSNIEELTEQL